MKVSVVIPALNEDTTVAGVVAAALADKPYEVLVIDADSTDSTAARAHEAGAQVYNWREILPDTPTRPGKGESLWRGVAAANGDIVVFMDADLTAPKPGMVRTLAAPFGEPNIAMVRASYPRTLDGAIGEGGRVTELTAKPLLELYFPELTEITQPLGGEYALRRSVALEVPFVGGYGVEAGLLIDVARTHGVPAITQVDLPARSHRNKPLAQLRPMAGTIAQTILSRAGVWEGDIAQRPALRTVGLSA